MSRARPPPLHLQYQRVPQGWGGWGMAESATRNPSGTHLGSASTPSPRPPPCCLQTQIFTQHLSSTHITPSRCGNPAPGEVVGHSTATSGRAAAEESLWGDRPPKLRPAVAPRAEPAPMPECPFTQRICSRRDEKLEQMPMLPPRHAARGQDDVGLVPCELKGRGCSAQELQQHSQRLPGAAPPPSPPGIPLLGSPAPGIPQHTCGTDQLQPR